MVKTTRVQRLQEYSRIAHVLQEDPVMPAKEIAQKVDMSRNTVSKYLRNMFMRNFVIGPWISLKPHPNYKEYVYVMEFSDFVNVYKGLGGFPHVVDRRSMFGGWNTLVITDRLFDLSLLKGFRSLVYRGVKGYVYTPKTEYTTWDVWLERMYQQLDQFSPVQREPVTKRVVPPLDWDKKTWLLYHTFRMNMRKKVISTLKKIKVRHETYAAWLETLKDHCMVHTEFYPQGFKTYANHSFLLETAYKQSVISLLSLLPTTPVIIEVGDRLLTFIKVDTPDATRNVFTMITDMKARDMITDFAYAAIASDYRWSHEHASWIYDQQQALTFF
jgi:DNA-binding Lrp family transcriptional regulator